jgi:hypothetical protein
MAAARADATTPPGKPAQPPAVAVLRAVADLIRDHYPQAVNVRIVYDVPDGAGPPVRGVIPVPVCQPAGDDLEADILAVLGRLAPGQWLKRRSLACEIDEYLDPTSGHFNRVLAKLRDAGRIESDSRQGYRLSGG